MKKYFVFAAIAAAGLLTSCSSDDDIASEVPVNPIEQGDEQVPIQIGIGQMASADVTRGTGTVGGTTAVTNLWDKQIVNVFMFNKGTLTFAKELDANQQPTGDALFDNVAMTTPAGAVYGQAVEYVKDDWDAQTPNDPTDDKVYIKHKYYPMTGNYDFWGYHIDDARALDANNDPKPINYQGADNTVLVPFVIDGSQDLMSARAALTDLTANGGINQITTMAGKTGKYHEGQPDEILNSERYFSAYSARSGVHPNLSFKHLLTRLTFNIIAGNDEARGYDVTDPLNPVAPAANSIYKGVFVKAIMIKSKNTGDLIAAYVPQTAGTYDKTPAQLVNWDLTAGNSEAQYGTEDASATVADEDAYDALDPTLQAGKGTDLAGATIENNKDKYYFVTGDKAYKIVETVPAVNANGYAWLSLKSAEKTPNSDATYKAVDASGTYANEAALDAAVTAGSAVKIGNGNTDAMTAATIAANLGKYFYNTTDSKVYKIEVDEVGTASDGKLMSLYNPTFFDDNNVATWTSALTVGSANYDKVWKPTTLDATNATQVGGADAAILVSPENNYEMQVILGQYLLDLEHSEAGTTDKYILKWFYLPSITLTPKEPATTFEPGTSYNVNITAYGATEIKVYTTLEQWGTGDAQDVTLE